MLRRHAHHLLLRHPHPGLRPGTHSLHPDPTHAGQAETTAGSHGRFPRRRSRGLLGLGVTEGEIPKRFLKHLVHGRLWLLRCTGGRGR
ncbi:MAG: hypothetical protein CBD47_08035 [Synechococcus sp. TMED187]|nr:MAG: hypothetical protein CBD47_08035 [Synechococcus sp. TMED187]